MATIAEAVRAMQLRQDPGVNGRQLGQERAARVHLAQIACPELAEGPGTSADSTSGRSQSADFVCGSFRAGSGINQWMQVNMKSSLTIVARRWCRASVARRAGNEIANRVWSTDYSWRSS